MKIKINETTWMELTSVSHAPSLFDAVEINREHLGRFLSWVSGMRSVENFIDYTSNCEALYLQGREISFVIFHEGKLAGRIGLHQIDVPNKQAFIGYWLTSEAEGKGIITDACRTLIKYGFETLGLHRLELRAAVDNIRSLAIAPRLGFNKEGILRQAEWVNGTSHDLAVFSLLRQEWSQ